MAESEDNKKKEAAKKRASLKQAVKDISSAGGANGISHHYADLFLPAWGAHYGVGRQF